MVALSAFVLLITIGATSAQIESYKGCYTASIGLTASGTSQDMVNADCVEHCRTQGMAYSATGEGKHCVCLTAADMQNLSPVSDSQCDVSCTGKLTEKCGGTDETVSVWSTGQGKRELAAKTTSENLRTTSTQSYKGCYTTSDGALTASDHESSLHMTNQDCAKHCVAQGKAYSATGEGKHCVCLTAADMQNLSPVSDSQCDVSCTGKLTEKCGGTDETVTVWSTGQGKRELAAKTTSENLRTTSTQSYKGCYTTSDGALTASGHESSLHMTNQDCAKHCVAQGKAYSGKRSFI
ncbi:PREDICTED: WSC domain-containing protein 2-like isoform X2 [Branchiostoma belcheri]|uniref:WSC domain-containing protein 2-like isoform X1 n=1 Tax=Branchiostoma belcheri TaxID=7741 RepID=A0A6P4YLV8_BRABE|nr:PREDICTED: WSC domain-containing protein 2-like isoform X1 [Branchiostoma belcheri]XP_019622679.1 PREDICTED: WSC domain-containing protein 2-like isoform X2 [Branchiostoma belcheri]